MNQNTADLSIQPKPDVTTDPNPANVVAESAMRESKAIERTLISPVHRNGHGHPALEVIGAVKVFSDGPSLSERLGLQRFFHKEAAAVPVVGDPTSAAPAAPANGHSDVPKPPPAPGQSNGETASFTPGHADPATFTPATTGTNGTSAAGAAGKAAPKRVVAVDDVSLTVERGEIFGVLGPNGTGKSTLIRLMSTLLIPDAGTIRVFGHDVTQEEMLVKQMINRVSVEASFFKKLSPMENLMYAARLYKVDMQRAKEQAVIILKRLGLEDRSIWSPMEDMSRGMQQKVAIARAFLTAPVLLLLDEPTTGLDPHSKREVQAFVREMRDNHDTTVLLTTHDMYEADALCDRIAIVDKGRIVALDTPAGLKALVQTRWAEHPEKAGQQPTLEDVFLELTGHKLSTETAEVAA